MTVLHYENDSRKETCMSSVVHLLVLGSHVLGSEIFFTFYIFFIFFYIFIFSQQQVSMRAN